MKKFILVIDLPKDKLEQKEIVNYFRKYLDFNQLSATTEIKEVKK